MGLLDDVRRVLLCHAHPDDETMYTAPLVPELKATGVAVDLVTSNRGERGEVVPEVAARLGSEALEELRMREVAAAIEVLGIDRHVFLGTSPARAAGLDDRRYRDSGMAWVRRGLAGPAPDSGADAFSRADIEEELADLLALVDAWRPDALVSYDANGGYGHPDHIRMHQLAAAAAEARSLLFLEAARRPGDGVEWHDTPHLTDTWADAIRCFASQMTVQPDGPTVVHVGGQAHPIATGYGLARGPRPLPSEALQAD